MDEKLRHALGDAARAARLRLGLSQAEVAKKVRLKGDEHPQKTREGENQIKQLEVAKGAANSVHHDHIHDSNLHSRAPQHEREAGGHRRG